MHSIMVHCSFPKTGTIMMFNLLYPMVEVGYSINKLNISLLHLNDIFGSSIVVSIIIFVFIYIFYLFIYYLYICSFIC